MPFYFYSNKSNTFFFVKKIKLQCANQLIFFRVKLCTLLFDCSMCTVYWQITCMPVTAPQTTVLPFETKDFTVFVDCSLSADYWQFQY